MQDCGMQPMSQFIFVILQDKVDHTSAGICLRL